MNTCTPHNRDIGLYGCMGGGGGGGGYQKITNITRKPISCSRAHNNSPFSSTSVSILCIGFIPNFAFKSICSSSVHKQVCRCSPSTYRALIVLCRLIGCQAASKCM